MLSRLQLWVELGLLVSWTEAFQGSDRSLAYFIHLYEWTRHCQLYHGSGATVNEHLKRIDNHDGMFQ
ncbi:uncharacterized protein N7443_006619 [Penicillium atrosanguineum]|uniref:uncharacterized protein n=1 Tax=Penicillium atrosanguineum TaxID=1132637 RepID=UPI00239DF5E0|nr:uncharacterized protein N7443_006619 [Penicillium atrosanguineum]KAJ5298499.1 hypothetical protein N7443_006619 [Penicillium atrosanguineum]